MPTNIYPSWRNARIGLFLFTLLSSFFLTSTAYAGCKTTYCSLATTKGVYPNIVVGKLVHVASDKEMASVVRWVKANGDWQNLPDSPKTYQRYLKMVTIDPGSKSKPLTVFMMQREYDAAPLRIGDLVRYHVHDPEWEAPKIPASRTLYYGLTGCVATLCTKTDKQCSAGFQAGVFNPEGAQINPVTGETVPKGTVINPISMRPIRTAATATSSTKKTIP